MIPRIGSLFSGAGGLDLAVEAVFGGRTVWHFRGEVAALEDELVAARAIADDWRNIAIQLAATCRDLRGELAAAR